MLVGRLFLKTRGLHRGYSRLTGEKKIILKKILLFMLYIKKILLLILCCFTIWLSYKQMNKLIKLNSYVEKFVIDQSVVSQQFLSCKKLR